MKIGSVGGAGDPPVCGVLKNAMTLAQSRDGNLRGTEIGLDLSTKGMVNRTDLVASAQQYNAEQTKAGKTDALYTGNVSSLHDGLQLGCAYPFSSFETIGIFGNARNEWTTQKELLTEMNKQGCPTKVE